MAIVSVCFTAETAYIRGSTGFSRGGRMVTKAAHKSFRYKNSVAWNSGLRGTLSTADKPAIEVGSPPEFKGEPGLWAPEELLVGALNACLMLTFLWQARIKKLDFAAYESAADGLLENADGTYLITEISVQPKVVLKSRSDLEAAAAIMNELEKNCFISNSIKAKVLLTPQFDVE